MNAVAPESRKDVLSAADRQLIKLAVGEDATIRMTPGGWEELADFIESGADRPTEALQRAAERNADLP